jgi:hypothetical protein
MNAKSADSITLEDFQRYAVWEPTDDLEDDEHEIAPCVNFDTLNVENIYFVATQYRLADGTVFDGYMRISWGEVKMLALALENDKFARFAVGIEDIKEKYHAEFANTLNRKLDDVFPLNFQTRIKFSINGEIV